MCLLFTGDCKPFAEGVNVDGLAKPIVPCGAIANSLFNGRSNLEFPESESDDVSFDDFIYLFIF